MSTQTYASTEQRREGIRVPVEEGKGLFGKLLGWYSRRTYGDVLDNALVLQHHKPMLWTIMRFEGRVARWNRLDPDLTVLAELASADLGEDGFVELTMMVAVENERSRFNSALGLTSQGFKAQCELRR